MTLEDLVLSTLSFYEPMNMANIILDMDHKVLVTLSEFDQKELDRILIFLEHEKLIKKSKIKGEFFWIGVLRKRSYLDRLLVYFSELFN